MDTLAKIIRYCQYQERCHSEVRNKLYELGCYTKEVEDKIATLIEMGIINEERFARAYARGHFRLKQWGKEKIKQQLKLKKVSDYCIKKALTEIDGEDYAATIEKLFQKKFKELKSERSKAMLKSKLFRYMIQKGYEKDIILDLIKTAIPN